MNFRSGIKPDVKVTFGDMIFMGMARERREYDPDKSFQERPLQARVYNLASSTQGEQIEVTVPEYVDEKEIDFNAPVELKNPTIRARAQASGNGFANVIWTVEAEDIVEVGKKTSKEPMNEPVASGAEKK
ncbi:YdcP family protein [Salicibibacter cibi]|uniref:YdcP family protein n=1 Tax=Salicibibacter cibi TaxID=2743001 RepID=A0A7T6Z9Q6_9BACI|nr:DUF961 family protein [Salicibibacter cibi]QQK79508.1 YdcP family protein [Salicibibacter cibi]